MNQTAKSHSAQAFVQQANRFSAIVQYLMEYPDVLAARVEQEVRDLQAREKKRLQELPTIAAGAGVLAQSNTEYESIKAMISLKDLHIASAGLLVMCYRSDPDESILADLEAIVEALKD